MCTSTAGISSRAKYLVTVEIALDDPALVERQLRFEDGAEAEPDATLHLRPDIVRIDGDAAIDGETTRCTFGWPFSTDISAISATTVPKDLATATPRNGGGKRLAPGGLFRLELQRGDIPGMVLYEG